MCSEFNSLNEILSANKTKLGEILKKLEAEIEEFKNKGPIRSNRTSDTFIIRHNSTSLLNANSSFSCLNESIKNDDKVGRLNIIAFFFICELDRFL
jgi:hypothetical protein